MPEKTAEGLESDAKEALEQHDYDRAYQLYREALDSLRGLPGSDHEKKIWAPLYRGIIESLDKGGKWVRALEYAGVLISEAVNKRDKRLEIEARLMTCTILLNHGNWPEAKKRLYVTLDLAQRSGSDIDLADCHYGLGYIDWRTGNIKQGRFKATKALDLLEGKGDVVRESKVIILLATLENEAGNSDDSISRFKDAIRKLETIGPHVELARAYNNLGETYKALEDYASAAEQYEHCVKVSKSIKSKRGILYGLANTAECYVYNGETDKAKNLLDEVTEMLTDTPEKYITAQVPHIRGLMFSREGEYAKACVEFQKALKGLARIGNPPYDVGISYFQWGLALRKMGDKDASLEAFENAKKNFVKAEAKTYLKRLKQFL